MRQPPVPGTVGQEAQPPSPGHKSTKARRPPAEEAGVRSGEEGWGRSRSCTATRSPGVMGAQRCTGDRRGGGGCGQQSPRADRAGSP